MAVQKPSRAMIGITPSKSPIKGKPCGAYAIKADDEYDDVLANEQREHCNFGDGNDDDVPAKRCEDKPVLGPPEDA